MLDALLKGALISGGLIIAIGAQNAFVLKQGLRREHVFWVALICFLCDFTLISAGVLGLGGAIAQNKTIAAALALFGAVFLFWYGYRSFRSAFAKAHQALVTDHSGGARHSLRHTVLATLAITLLNPHVYIDTVVLIGAVAAPLAPADKYAFLTGAISASALWFFGIAYGARLLKPLFANPRAWQILETLIGIMMCWLAWGLLRDLLAILGA